MLRERAKAMRSMPTDAEHRLWQILRAKRFSGFKFRRQVPIDHYVVDFLCPARRLVVEVDGGQHGGSGDVKRDRYLEAQGFQILRIWNNDLFKNEAGVCETLLAALSPLPNPSPAEGRGA